MIRFMVLSAPRSASTWVANWLTTEKTLCLHDPVMEHSPAEFDALPCDRVLGIACTGLALLADFVNAHAARKIVVHRDLIQVNKSLTSIGLWPLGSTWMRKPLEDIDCETAYHVHYQDLFEPARAKVIYEYLLEQPFDAPRHEQLCAMHIEPNFEALRLKPERARAFRRQVEEAFNARAAREEAEDDQLIASMLGTLPA